VERLATTNFALLSVYLGKKLASIFKIKLTTELLHTASGAAVIFKLFLWENTLIQRAANFSQQFISLVQLVSLNTFVLYFINSLKTKAPTASTISNS
jgi:hypothetical protein